MKLDNWQQKILDTEGNICLRSGRQVGKSTIIAIKAAHYAANHKNKTVLIIASVERQAQLLFEKVMAYLFDNHKAKIQKGKDKPTKHKVKLTNNTTILCLPTGLSGFGIRGYTVDMLIADEAAFIPEEVWTAVTPMLAVTRGKIILLSTPFGKGGYFYRCFNDPKFTTFHVSSEDCPRKDQDFLDQEKKRMTSVQYAQEYLGEFIDELRQFFPTELVRSCMTARREGLSLSPASPGKYFLGVDVARMGGDEAVLVTVKLDNKKNLTMIDMDIKEMIYTTEIVKNVKYHNLKYNYKRIYIDSTGMGYAVYDPLLMDNKTKRKVVAIDNAQRNLDNEGKKLKSLMKEDLYNNLLVLMEQGKIQLLDETEVLLSLKSIQKEYVNNKLRIHGHYSHITEALIRAAWCVKDKRLNIWIY